MNQFSRIIVITFLAIVWGGMLLTFLLVGALGYLVCGWGGAVFLLVGVLMFVIPAWARVELESREDES